MRHVRALSVGSLAEYQKLNELHFKKSPDKPIHAPTQSLFTTTSGFNNFRGLLNWGAFLLIITTSRMALENVIKYGIVIDPFVLFRYLARTSDKYITSGLLLCCNLFIMIAFSLERCIIYGWIRSDRLITVLTVGNLAGVLIFPTTVILLHNFDPFFSGPILAFYTVLFLKLWSYSDVNRWCRAAKTNKENQKSAVNDDLLQALSEHRRLEKLAKIQSPSIVESDNSTERSDSSELPEPSEIKESEIGHCDDQSSRSPSDVEAECLYRRTRADMDRRNQPDTVTAATSEPRSVGTKPRKPMGNRLVRMSVANPEEYQSMLDAIDLEPRGLVPTLSCHEVALLRYRTYPHNVTFGDLYYFMVAPTLCYELNFPKTMVIRKPFLFKRLFEVLFLTQLTVCLAQQWMIPTLKNSVTPITSLDFSQIVERCLKLAIPNHLIWLLCFYTMFHSFLNMVAELLCFGDRFFYSDWWNAESIPAFWSKWNIPVHRFARRHIYIPLLSQGWTRPRAGMVVFFISALLHEFLVSVPLKMPRMWAFLGMFSQMPCALLVHHLFPSGGTFGNVAVWIALIIGQPLAILFYFHDYYIAHYIT